MGEQEKLAKTAHSYLPWHVANLEADPGLIFYSMGEQEKFPKTAQYPSPLVWSLADSDTNPSLRCRNDGRGAGMQGLGGERCKVFEKSKYFDSESVTYLITSLKSISRNLVLLIAKQYLEKDSIFSNI